MKEEIFRLIIKIGGSHGRDCYQVLAVAVEVMTEYYPDIPKMTVITKEAARRLGKTDTAVSGALSRAVRDMWERGVRAQLQDIFENSLWQKPAPKAVVTVMAQYLMRQNKELT